MAGDFLLAPGQLDRHGPLNWLVVQDAICSAIVRLGGAAELTVVEAASPLSPAAGIGGSLTGD